MFTKLERRKIYWRMYVVAEGLATMTTKEHRNYYRDCQPFTTLPDGYCELLYRMNESDSTLYWLFELKNYEPRLHADYWWASFNWRVRSKYLLLAYRDTFTNNLM